MWCKQAGCFALLVYGTMKKILLSRDEMQQFTSRIILQKTCLETPDIYMFCSAQILLTAKPTAVNRSFSLFRKEKFSFTPKNKILSMLQNRKVRVSCCVKNAVSQRGLDNFTLQLRLFKGNGCVYNIRNMVV